MGETYRCSYTAELCRALSIYEAIDYILLSVSHTPTSYHILIETDCTAVIDMLGVTLSVIFFIYT